MNFLRSHTVKARRYGAWYFFVHSFKYKDSCQKSLRRWLKEKSSIEVIN